MAIDGIHNYITVITDGINELKIDAKVYPNPTNDQVNIEAEGMNRVTVINSLGQNVYDAETDANQMVVDMSQFGAGMYLIRIIFEDGVSVRRVLKQ